MRTPSGEITVASKSMVMVVPTTLVAHSDIELVEHFNIGVTVFILNKFH